MELAGLFSRGNMLVENRPEVEGSKDFKPNVTLVYRVDEKGLMAAVLDAFKMPPLKDEEDGSGGGLPLQH